MKCKIQTIWIAIFFACFLTSVSATVSNGFQVDFIAASVDNKPITLNDLYFLYNFNMVNNLKYVKINETLPKAELKRLTNIYINRIIILKQQEKAGGLIINNRTLKAMAQKFKKKFAYLHRHTSFSFFLSKFGFDKNGFYNFLKKILIEKKFIKYRLQFFLFTIENGRGASKNQKQKYSAELAKKLKNMIINLRMHAKIKINDNFSGS
ncbi:MAG: hypothetical protein ACP5NA_01645 [Candidatus Acidulodesulfobacterium sp.]